MLSALRWVSFLWGLAALVVMSYCAYRWFPDPSSPKLSEMQLGFILAAYGGAPAWVSLPLLGLAQSKSLPRWQTYAHFVLPVIAALLYLWGQSLAPGGV